MLFSAHKKFIALWLPLWLIFTACGGNDTATTLPPTATLAAATDTPLIPPTVTPTLEPTATPVPLAALVNGEAITLAEYEAELVRYQTAMAEFGTNLATNAEQVVLDELINQLLLAQAARAQGFIVDDATLQTNIDELSAQLGGGQALADWMVSHGYSEMDFRLALRRSMEAAWMRDKIAASIPETVEQVHARQILLYNSEDANYVYGQLQSGSDFTELAAQIDPQTQGELGWFPRGYLTQPELEEAAFGLEPGQYSPVIETELGYSILFVIERDPQHSLTPDARLALQQVALLDWLQAQQSQSVIEVLLP